MSRVDPRELLNNMHDDERRPPEIILYDTEDGRSHVRLYAEDGTVWLTQRQMAELFDVGVSSVSKHLKAVYDDGELTRTATVARKENVGVEQGRNVRRLIDHYNLDAILAVGFRVRGPRGAQFRKWATEILTEYLVKGFALDDKRLKDPVASDHFEELLDRIRDIRASERRFYKKVTDVIAATAGDYHPSETATKDFFAALQNKLHWATFGKTAAELVCERVDHRRPNCGLTTWAGERPRLADTRVAKNFLHDEELRTVNRLTTMFLDYAEDQTGKRKQLFLSDWAAQTDKFLEFNDRDVLSHKGARSRSQMKTVTKQEWDAYQHRLTTELEEKELAAIEEAVQDSP
ncbi:RhuM family protein [Corynebacterium sp. AOP34-AQ2-28]|uniref:RhuM family protein n=1 Tax=Corynebacterium TaxID=1716 RepID=UPI003FD5462C